MGNKVCCNSSEDAHTHDMISPAQPQGIFLKERSEVTEDDNGEQRRGRNDSLRVKLLGATRRDDAPTVLQFVADGADIATTGEALRLAAQWGCASVVRELVAVGLSVNDGCPRTGFTPLQLAAASGNLTVCELLLDALADVHKSRGGSTALSLARKMGNMEVEEVLERHVASLVGGDDVEGEEASQMSRRAHVLPRVSPELSEAVLQSLQHVARPAPAIPPPMTVATLIPPPLDAGSVLPTIATPDPSLEANPRVDHNMTGSRAL